MIVEKTLDSSAKKDQGVKMYKVAAEVGDVSNFLYQVIVERRKYRVVKKQTIINLYIRRRCNFENN